MPDTVDSTVFTPEFTPAVTPTAEPVVTTPVEPVVTSTAEVSTSLPAWDGRKESVTALPYWSTLSPEIQASLLSGVDVVETRWSESTAAAEQAAHERQITQALADLLDARDTGSVDLARDLNMYRTQAETAAAELATAKAEYEAQLKSAADGHQLSTAELVELRTAKAALEAAQQESVTKVSQLEAQNSEYQAQIAKRDEEFATLQLTAIDNHFRETRPDLAESEAAVAAFYDLLQNPVTGGDLEKAYRYLAVEFPPPPKPDTVPDAVALMNNASTAAPSLADSIGKGTMTAQQRLNAQMREITDRALMEDSRSFR